jgi:hypothetical protein
VPEFDDYIFERLGEVVSDVERAVKVVGSLAVGEEVGDVSEFVEDDFSLSLGWMGG